MNCAADAVASSVRVGVGAGVVALKAVTGSKEGLRNWTRRRKDEDETVLVVATSAGALAMREARPCGSERAAEGRGGGDAAEEDADVTGLGLTLGLGLAFAAAVCLWLERGLGGGWGGGERRRGGEAPEMMDPPESESPSRGGEYIGSDAVGAVPRFSSPQPWTETETERGKAGD